MVKHPFQPVLNTSQVKLNWTTDGVVAANVLHYVGVGGTAQAPAAVDVCPAIIANFTAAVRATITTDTILTSIEVTNLTDQNRLAEVYTAGLPLAGTKAAVNTPTSTAMVVKLRTDKRGRSYRGRVYVPGVEPPSGAGRNAFAAADVNAWLGFFNAITTISPTSGVTYGLCIVSRIQNGLWLSNGVATPVVSVSSDGKVHTQRRRLGY